MKQEKIYDEQISPLMQQIIEICKENNITMFADFRMDEEISCQTILRFDNSMTMKMYEACRQCSEGNSFQLDKLLFWIIKTFDTSQSLFSKVPLGDGKKL